MIAICLAMRITNRLTIAKICKISQMEMLGPQILRTGEIGKTYLPIEPR